ncbi:hypothetical protein [Verrucomicrobium spinosum]|uniref:hypothetical protein n=1 Tax=Verrucomicrobium spinosum TaxID=2736 RepID=UPI000A7CA8D4|nr:hypothetical protein [Verrucomicrobium spinosum]
MNVFADLSRILVCVNAEIAEVAALAAEGDVEVNARGMSCGAGLSSTFSTAKTCSFCQKEKGG